MERIGRYAILEKLGEGGMGVVYAAEDLRLERKVALKTIHKHLADATGRRRMWREARTASAVAHPNICQVYEFGEDGEELFLAMELLEGEPLSDRLARGPLPLREAIAVGIAIASALEAVHGEGVIHRDLKPSNIFLTPHGARLLDFGLAVPLAGANSLDRITQTGVFVGTPGFMAPELWRAEEPSPASDLFALGAILIEMIAGIPAFQGDGPADLLHAILHDPAPTLTGGESLEAVDRVVQSALAKDPRDRPQTAHAFSAALRSALAQVDGTETPGALVLHRLLVIPFRMVRADEELEFLPVGLADALIASLGSIAGMVVKSSHVGARYAGVEIDPGRIAEETEVQHVLTGTIQRAGNRLRVHAQLMAVPDGSLVWSETIEASVGDLFQLQDDLTRRIVESFARDVVGRRQSSVRAARPATAKAYEYFLRANQMSYNFGMLSTARAHYRVCLGEDPEFAPAWARLGRVCRVLAKYGHEDGEALREEAGEAFRKALEIAPDLALAHNLYAYYEIEELRKPVDAMVRLLGQARRAPTDPDLFAGLVVATRFCGLLDASIEADRRARRLDPGIRTSVAYTHFMRGEYEAAVLTDDEDFSWNHIYALPMLGREDEAIAILKDRELRSTQPFERIMLGSARAGLEGDRKECLRYSHALLDSTFGDAEGLFFEVRGLARVGASKFALRAFADIVDRGFAVVEVFEKDPWLDPLRASPKFEAVLERARSKRREGMRAFEEAGGVALLGESRR